MTNVWQLNATKSRRFGKFCLFQVNSNSLVKFELALIDYMPLRMSKLSMSCPPNYCAHEQCDQMAVIFFNIGIFKTMKICPIA